MAGRRMFSREITDSDAFCEMPLTTQALYFHLGMQADDEGVVNSAKRIQRCIGANDDDMRILAARKFIIPFDSGVIVIKHWRINNYIRGDRKRESKYGDIVEQLEVQENGAYTLGKNSQGRFQFLSIQDEETSPFNSEQVIRVWDDICQADDGQMPDNCQRSIGKDSIGKDKDILSGKPDHASETAEIISYLNEVVGSSYRPSSKQTVRHINARLKEGYTVADFKAVIDCKCREWGGGDMAKYLRPETLFSPKFEGYVNQAKAEDSKRSRYAKYD